MRCAQLSCGIAADRNPLRIAALRAGRNMAITLSQTALLLGAAVLAVSIFRLLRLSSILGYVADESEAPGADDHASCDVPED